MPKYLFIKWNKAALPIISLCLNLMACKEKIVTEKVNQETIEKKCSTPSKLLCIDFDETIVLGHFHSLLTNPYRGYVSRPLTPFVEKNGLIINGKPSGEVNKGYSEQLVIEKTNELLNDKKIGLRDPEGLKKLFDKNIAQGNKVSITSFTKFPSAITCSLERLGYRKEEIKNNFIIICGFHLDGIGKGKKGHIDKAKELTGIKNYSDVLVIDDNKNILERLKNECKCNVLHVTDNFKWQAVENKLKEMENDEQLQLSLRTSKAIPGSNIAKQSSFKFGPFTRPTKLR